MTTKAELTAFSSLIQGEKITPDAMEEFARELLAIIELASPGLIPAQDIQLGLTLLSAGMDLIFRAGMKTLALSGKDDMGVALQFVHQLGHEQVDEANIKASLFLLKELNRLERNK